MKDERLRDAPFDDALNVARELSRFAHGMLRERRIWVAIRSRNRCAVAERPHLRVAAAPHRTVDDDPATLIVDDRYCARDGARNGARGQHDCARLDRLVREVHTSGLDRANRRGHAHVSTTPVEHPARHGR